jgi:hypothetical protein
MYEDMVGEDVDEEEVGEAIRRPEDDDNDAEDDVEEEQHQEDAKAEEDEEEEQVPLDVLFAGKDKFRQSAVKFSAGKRKTAPADRQGKKGQQQQQPKKKKRRRKRSMMDNHA